MSIRPVHTLYAFFIVVPYLPACQPQVPLDDEAPSDATVDEGMTVGPLGLEPAADDLAAPHIEARRRALSGCLQEEVNPWSDDLHGRFVRYDDDGWPVETFYLDSDSESFISYERSNGRVVSGRRVAFHGGEDGYSCPHEDVTETHYDAAGRPLREVTESDSCYGLEVWEVTHEQELVDGLMTVTTRFDGELMGVQSFDACGMMTRFEGADGQVNRHLTEYSEGCEVARFVLGDFVWTYRQGRPHELWYDGDVVLQYEYSNCAR